MAKLRLREVAEAQGKNMYQIARDVGLSHPTVRRYWYGTQDGKRIGPKLNMIRLDALEKIADYLNVEPGELIVRDQPRSGIPPTEG